MKLKMLLLACGLTVVPFYAYGAACNTFSGGTYATLQAASSCTSTYTNFTITFSNFTLATGTAADLTVSASFNNPTGLGGFSFTSSVAGGGDLNAFSGLGYTATVSGCAVGFTCGISGYLEQSLFTNTPTSGELITVTESAGPTPVQLLVGTQTVGPAFFAQVNPFTKSATYNGVGNLQSFETDVFASATPGVPEPTTSLLIGTGLLGLGAIRRRFNRSS